jgi:transposase InsO family protein
MLIPNIDLYDAVVEQQVSFFDTIVKNYDKDIFFKKVMDAPERYKIFSLNDGLIVTENAQGHQVTCIPLSIFKGRRSTEIIVDQAHRILGHLGAQKMNKYVCRWFWWPKIGKYIDLFCESCDICQATKTVNQKPQGFLHSMPIPDRPWASIAMDFVGPFPPSNNFDYVWVVLDCFMSLVHLVPTTTTVTASKLAALFIEHIVRLHGLPDSIVSDRDTKFTAKFWAETHRLLGVQLLRSTAFHPQTDGASERMI